MNNTFDDVDNPSDNEELSDIDGGGESAQHEQKNILPPPAYGELSDFFGPREKITK